MRGNWCVILVYSTKYTRHWEHGYRSVPGKRPLPGKHPCTEFQGVTVAYMQLEIYILGKRPCGPKSRVMFKHPWALTQDAMVYASQGLSNWFCLSSVVTMKITRSNKSSLEHIPCVYAASYIYPALTCMSC